MTEKPTKKPAQQSTTTDDSKKPMTKVEKLRAKKAAEEEKVKAIDEQLKQAEALERKQEAAKQKRLNEIERKKDNRRKIIIGGTFRAEAEKRLEKKDPALYDEMVRLLDQWVVNSKDRELFNDLIKPLHRSDKSEDKHADNQNTKPKEEFKATA